MCWTTRSLQYTAAPKSSDSQVCTEDIDYNAEHFKNNNIIISSRVSYSSFEILEYNAYWGSIEDFKIRNYNIQITICLALTSPTSGGRSVGIVRSQTKATELVKPLGVTIAIPNQN
jgi:hypothetical protein